MKKTFMFILFILLSYSFFSTIINVPAEQPTIQDGINVAVDGDTILVQPGTYFENINYNGKNITVASLFLTTQDTTYISQTIIDGNQNGSVVIFESGEDSTAIITGFTITNGNGTDWWGDCYGGGIFCYNSSPKFKNLTITGNHAQEGSWVGGGGIYCRNSSPDLENIKVINNYVAEGYGHGGGIFLHDSNPSLVNVLITNNSSDWDGGGIYCWYFSSPSLENVTIVDNYARESGGGICSYSNSNPSLENVTIVDNSATDGGGIYLEYSNPSLVNVLITGNSATRGGGISLDDSNPIFDSSNRCNIYLNHASTSGNDLYASAFTNVEVVVDTFTILQPDDYFASPIGNFTFDIINARIDQVNTDLYVNPNGSNYNSGLYPEDPILTISYALSKIIADSLNPRIIHLSNGTYSPSQTGEDFPINCRNYVSIIGESEDLTILDGDDIIDCMIIFSNDNNLTLKNLTITNAYSTGPFCDRDYGAVKIISSNPNLQNIKIFGNSFVPNDYGCQYGAVFCNGSSPIFQNLMIYSNGTDSWEYESYSWGILCTYSDLICNDVIIFWNGSMMSNGGGVFCWGSNPIFNNVIIYGNSGFEQNYSGGISCDNNSNPNLLNCIIRDNIPDQIYINSGSVTADYSNIQGGWPSGDGNIDSDPLFMDPYINFHLQEDSPCIDAGNPDPIYYDPENPNNPGYALYPAMGTIINDMGAYGGPEAISWYPPNNGIIIGIITDSQNGSPIENATVFASGNYYSNPTTQLGEYSINNVPFGIGYHIYAFATGYSLTEITGIDLTQQNPIATVDIELTPITGDYEIVNLTPNPNHAVSTIMQEGSVHRYYLVRDENTLNPGLGIEIEVESQDNNYTFSSNQNGIIEIFIESTDIGNGQPGSLEDFSISFLNEEPINPTIDFTCEVLNPVYGKYWDSNEYGKLGISFFSIDAERGSSTKLIENDQDEINAELIFITRQGRAGIGVDFSVGVGAGVQCGEISAGAGASAGVGGNISGITEDYYEFPHQNYNNWQALAQYILVADGNFGNLDNTLIRFLSLLEEQFSDETTLNDAYLGDKKGIDACVSASASANIGVIGLDVLNIGAGANIGTEGHILFNVINHNQSNENEYNLGISGTLTSSAYGGITMNIPTFENWSDGLRDLLNIDDFDGTRGMQFSVYKDNTSNLFTKFQLKFLHRKENLGWEEVLIYTISGNDVYIAIESIITQVQILCNPSSSTGNINVTNSIFSQLVNNIFQVLYDLQADQQGDATISYQIERKDIDNIDPFDIDIGISLTSAVKAQLGGGVGFEEGKTKVKEIGKWVCGNHLVLEEYGDNIPDIPEEYEDVLQEIVDMVPLSIRMLLGLLDWLIPGRDDATFYVGDTGSYIFFPDGSIPPEVDSIACVSWSWYGNSPGRNLSDVSINKRSLYIKNRIRAERNFGMRYGVGGFYQFEPLNTTLLEDCDFTIVYPDSNVVDIDESTLGMYKEDKENHTWIFMGGVIDTLNNTVTAPVTELALYTLAPRMPLGEFGLNANPDSLYADSVSTTVITSNIINYNNQNQVVDGELFTVNTQAGEIITQDVNIELEGIQIEAQNGMIQFELRSSHIASNPEVSAFSVTGSSEAHMHVTFYDNIPPSNPVNLNAMTGDERIYLNWSPNPEDDITGYKIYFDSDQPGEPYNGIATVYGFPSPITIGQDTTYTILGLYNNTTYYCAITSYDVSGNEGNYSNEVNIDPMVTPEPLPPTTPNPVNEATDVSIETDLSWTNGAYTDSVKVLLDTVNPPVTLVYNGETIDSLLNTDIDGPLDHNETFFWQVVCRNVSGETSGDVWSFTSQQGPFIDVIPDSIGFGDVIINASSAEQFTIYNNGGDVLSGDITTPGGYSVESVLATKGNPKIINKRNTIEYTIEAGENQVFDLIFTPEEVMNYDGEVIITSNDPDNPTEIISVYGEGVLTEPEPPTNPNPENGATNIPINSELSWINGDFTDSVSVFLNSILIYDGPAIESLTNDDIGGLLDYSTQYYWQVVCRNESGENLGDEWDFTTVTFDANFTATQIIVPIDTEIQFLDQSTGNPISWAWDFDNDGTLDDTNQNCTWSYPNEGLFTVSLTVQDAFGSSDTEIKQDYIEVIIPSEFTKIELSCANTIDVGAKSAPAFTDLDNDGKLDLIVGETNGTLSHYEQIALDSDNYEIVTSNFNNIDVGYSSQPTFIDLDNDELLDMIVGGFGGYLPSKIYHYEQSSFESEYFNLITDSFSGITFGSGGLHISPTFTDIDDDNLIDMIIGINYSLRHYEQDTYGSINFSLITTNFNNINVGDFTTPCFEDLDGDGLLDLILGEWDGNLNHYEQDEQGSVNFNLITNNFNGIDVGGESNPSFINLDDDPLLELIIGESNGNLNYYKQDSLGSNIFNFITANFNDIIDVGNRSVPAFSDLDNDGLLDMVVGENFGQLFHYEQVSLGSSSFVYITNKFNEINLPFYSSPTFTDLDNDGLLDMIIGWGSNNLIHYEQNAPNSEYFVLITSNFSNINTGFCLSPTFTDLDNDELLDLIFGTWGGELIHYEQEEPSAENFSFVSSNFSGISYNTGMCLSPTFTDLDNDGLLELILGEALGNLNHYEQVITGSENFNIITQNFFDVDVGSYSTPCFIDINGDNFHDLIIGDENGKIHYYKRIPVEPETPSDPNPSDGTIDISIETDLSWTNGAYTDSVKVLLDTVNPPVTPVYNGIVIDSLTNSDIGGPLDYNETFFWQVICRNVSGETGGDVWSFSTEQEIYSGPIWHISTTGSDILGNGSTENPFATIQYGIEESTNGDTVLVQPGTYEENINYNGMNITIASLFLTIQDTSYIPQTIIDGNSTGSVVTFESGEDSSAILCGFTIINGSGTDPGNGNTLGGGIYCDQSSPSLENVTITNNSASDSGGGIYCFYSSPTFENVTICGNSANSGGGIYCTIYSNLSFVNVTISGNSANNYGGGIYSIESSSTLVNVTISDNSADYGGGFLCDSNSNASLVNCILWNNYPQEIYIDSGSVNATYCDIESGTGNSWFGTGCIDADPFFVDPVNGDYHLTIYSPCIDFGIPDTTGLSIPEFDLDGNPRIHNNRIDMGAYEFQGEPLQVDFSADVTYGNAPLSVQFTALNNYPADSYEWDFNNDETIDATGEIVNWEFPAGVYTITLYSHYGSEIFTETKSDFVTSVNQPPYIENPITSLSFDEDTINDSLDLNYIFFDENDDFLFFAFSGNINISVSIDETGIVTLEPLENWNGEETITFSADDGYQSRDRKNIQAKSLNKKSIFISNNKNLSTMSKRNSNRDSAFIDILVTVEPVNDSPYVQNEIPNQETIEDIFFSYTFPENTFADDDPDDVLSYNAELEDGNELPQWLDFNPETRTFSGTAVNEDLGILNIKVIADDDYESRLFNYINSRKVDNMRKIVTSSKTETRDTCYDIFELHVESGEPPSITVISPNGGEDWEIDSTHNITWTSLNTWSNVKIDLYDWGDVYDTIIPSTPDDGTFSWPIPETYDPGSEYTVRISDADDLAVFDHSNNLFTLSPPSPPAPAIDVSVTSLSSSIAPDVINDTLSFDITNIGDPGTNLTYSMTWEYTTTRVCSYKEQKIAEANDRGTPHSVISEIFNCDYDPTEESWLDLVPTSGDCNYSEIDVIDVEFNSSGLVAGIYTALITISNNAGPDEYIDVTLDVTEHPANVTFQAWITIRPEEILDENSTGCDYFPAYGYLMVQCGNFETQWNPGETLHLEVTNSGNGDFGSGDVLLTSLGFDMMDPIYLCPITAPDAPVITNIYNDGVNIYLEWDPVTGATSYTVYSDADPYGTFGTTEWTGTDTSWNEPLTEEMKFYRITASN